MNNGTKRLNWSATCQDEVHQMTNEGAELVTELVKKTKWYEHGLALLKLQKDFSPIYMN